MVKLSHNDTSYASFLTQVDYELKRAERYRIFISVLVLDISGAGAQLKESGADKVTELVNLVKRHIRATDQVSFLDSEKLAFLFPETTRQGAEIASHRITEMVKTKLSELENRRLDQVIPLEMASYPDAAGAKGVAEFLREYSEKNIN